eukprot:jgi/Tetstr1/441240/TSEL_003112.t2
MISSSGCTADGTNGVSPAQVWEAGGAFVLLTMVEAGMTVELVEAAAAGLRTLALSAPLRMTSCAWAASALWRPRAPRTPGTPSWAPSFRARSGSCWRPALARRGRDASAAAVRRHALPWRTTAATVGSGPWFPGAVGRGALMKRCAKSRPGMPGSSIPPQRVEDLGGPVVGAGAEAA